MKENNLPRILHVSSSRSWRGSEQQVSYLLDELKAQEWPSLLLCRSKSALRRYSKRHRIESISFKSRGFWNYLLAREICHQYRKRPFDLIHVHDSRAHAAAILARWMGVRLPVVVSRFAVATEKASWFTRRLFNHPANKAIVCVSEAVRNSLDPIIRKKALLRVIPSGIDPEEFDVEVPHGRLRREYFIPDDYALVGNVAALVSHKDYHTFLKTAKILLEQNPKMFFLAIGDGPLHDEIEKAAEKMELKDHFRITGSRKDLPEVLSQLDVLMSSSVTEGPATTVLNAFAAGIPVAATAAGSVPEMVKHEHSGMLSPVGDAQELANHVLRILNDETLRIRIIAGGKEKLQRFHRKVMAEKMLALYLELTGKTSLGNEKS
ncbi:MAG: glycosyltransferase family 4 protein [Bacteroides sp.]|jgi:glycosyltransferase involved in cell wall biosynthesis|nr:glycosyltransferase family 4 protein [Bacteroides sp.]